MSELPEGWLLSDIGTVCQYIQRGKSPKYDKKSKKYPVINQKCIRWDEIQSEHFKFVTPEFWKTIDEIRFLQKGDILWNSTGTGTIGRAALFEELPNYPKAVVDSHVTILRSHSGVNPKYLHYWIQSPDIQNKIEDMQSGTTNQVELSKGAIQASAICLAPENEQKRIAEKLDQILEEVNSAKNRLDHIPTLLKNFRQSVLEFAVNGDLSTEERKQLKQKPLTPQDLKEANFKTKAKKLETPSVNETVEGWLNVQIGHLFSVRSGKGLTAKNMAEGGTIPVYGGNGINGYHDEFNMDEPAVVIGRVGFYCGSVHYTEEKSWITDNALIVSFPEEIVSKKYAYFLLKATNLRGNMASSAQPVISGEKIYPVWLTIPPKEEQKIIINKIEDLMKLADQIEEKYSLAMENVEKITQSVLAKAFRGELVPQDPNDEPASVLLERIKEEKEAAAPKPKTTHKKKKNVTVEVPSTKMEIKAYPAEVTITHNLRGTLEKQGDMSPEELLRASKYTVDTIDEFYSELKEAINEQLVEEVKDDKSKTITLKAS
jgi:type I restriction enzyme S subunit